MATTLGEPGGPAWAAGGEFPDFWHAAQRRMVKEIQRSVMSVLVTKGRRRRKRSWRRDDEPGKRADPAARRIRAPGGLRAGRAPVRDRQHRVLRGSDGLAASPADYPGAGVPFSRGERVHAG